MADYESLSENAKQIIEVGKGMFGDCFDNSDFGPFIEEFTPYSNDRLATLLELAVGMVAVEVNIPDTNWSLSSYPFDGGVANYTLTMALVVNMIEHYIRSYVEIPDTSRVGAPDVQRRDYLNRWQGLLSDYKKQLADAGDQMAMDLYNANYAAGMYTKTLIDWPSVAGRYLPWNSAERPQLWQWW